MLGLRPQTSILRGGKAETLFKAPERHSPGQAITYMGHLDPVLHHSGPVPGHHAWVPEAGGDHTGDQRVVLADGGTDSGCPVLSSMLVLRGPDRAQALVGQHLLEQLLRREGSVTQPCLSPAQCPQHPAGIKLVQTKALEAEDVA